MTQSNGLGKFYTLQRYYDIYGDPIGYICCSIPRAKNQMKSMHSKYTDV